MPWLWILAGPNGSGKTTIAAHPAVMALMAGTPSLNADELAKKIAEAEGTAVTREISLQAARSIDAEVDKHVDDGRSFSVETVLSSMKYKATVRRARRAGFQIGLIFVFTSRADLNVLRVSQRVMAGGHDVPKDKVRARWTSSINNLAWFAGRADQLLVIDNSRAPEFLLERTPRGGCRQLGEISTEAVAKSLSKVGQAIRRLPKDR
ncbi:MAG: hypothetical protein DI537_10075 [Stutzerimonas stutzeri]|nr:MAG: hypothetical protein DI537_10075 [Stutzerimonas stutzeri]